ncbi:MAG: hypothetical protein JXR54_09865 [Tannerellaceae bacterium]|nr:hypothetical protein [Tannerellaceae bacterium]
MKALKDFMELLLIVWKDKIDVAMLLLMAVASVYFFVKGMDNAGAGLGFFWVYSLTSQLRIAWFKRELFKDE